MTEVTMSQTSHDPASNYMAKGFFFALGFVPVFLVLSGLTSWLSYKIIMHELNVQLDTAITNSRIQQQHLQQNIVRQIKPDVTKKSQPVAQIGEAPTLSAQEKQEQACNLAIIRYSQTNSPEDKNQVYALCPEK